MPGGRPLRGYRTGWHGNHVVEVTRKADGAVFHFGLDGGWLAPRLAVFDDSPGGVFAHPSENGIRLRDARGARDAYDRVLRIAPREIEALAGRGIARAILGEHGGARADLEAALAVGTRRDDAVRRALATLPSP